MKTVITPKISDSLREIITENPSNIKAACQSVAKRFNVKVSAVQGHYYQKLRKGPAMFITQTNGGVLINTKNSQATKVNSRRFVTLKAPVSVGSLTQESKAELFDLILNL